MWQSAGAFFFSPLFASSGLNRWSLFPRFDPVNKPGDRAWMWLPPPPVKTSRSLSDLCRRAEEGAHRLWFLLSPTNLRLSRSAFPFIPSSPRLSVERRLLSTGVLILITLTHAHPCQNSCRQMAMKNLPVIPHLALWSYLLSDFKLCKIIYYWIPGRRVEGRRAEGGQGTEGDQGRLVLPEELSINIIWSITSLLLPLSLPAI